MADNLDSLVQQVGILSQTVEALISRLEQTFKTHQDILSQTQIQVAAMKSDVQTAVLELQQARSDQEVINEALKGALSDADQIVDDLAKVTTALLQVQRQLNPSNSQVQNSQA